MLMVYYEKIQNIITCISIISLVFTTTSSLAETTATTTKEPISPPSCPDQLILKDEFYIGVAGGYDSYRVVDQVTG